MLLGRVVTSLTLIRSKEYMMIRVRYIARDAGFVRDYEEKELDIALSVANNVVTFPDDRAHVLDSLDRYGRYSAIGKTGWVEVFKPMKI
jgi:hypothetical protein